MPRKKERGGLGRETTDEARDAALLLVEHRSKQGGMGKKKAQELVSEAARQLALRRVATASKEELSALGTKGAKAYWASMTPKERQLEQRRRARTRLANKRKAAKARLK